MAKDPKTKEDKPLLAAVTGAIWKTAIAPENVERYDQLRTVEILVKLLEDVEEVSEVLSNVVGALEEMLKFQHNWATLRKAGGIPHLVNLLNYTYPPLLENVPMVLRKSAQDEDSMRIIEELDGVRLIWSLLKNDSPRVSIKTKNVYSIIIKKQKKINNLANNILSLGYLQIVLLET